MGAIKLSLHAAIACTILVALATAAKAQPIASCLVSMNVKKKPVILDLLPGGTVAQITSCEKAEAWRTQFYIANRSVIDAAAAGTSAFYVSELEKTLAARQAAVKDLEQKIANNANLSAMTIVAKVIIAEASKADALITCAKKPKSPSCALGVIGIITFTWDVITGDIAKDKFAEEVTKQKAQLADQTTQLKEIKAKMSAIDMAQIKADVEQTFVGLCNAIKRDCLH
jgi:hypothetical protein